MTLIEKPKKYKHPKLGREATQEIDGLYKIERDGGHLTIWNVEEIKLEPLGFEEVEQPIETHIHNWFHLQKPNVNIIYCTDCLNDGKLVYQEEPTAQPEVESDSNIVRRVSPVVDGYGGEPLEYNERM